MLLDIIFPRFCIECKKFGKYICTECQKNIYPISFDVCPSCQRNSTNGLKHTHCKGSIDGVISLFQYKGLMKKIVKKVKYQLFFSLWKEIIELIPEERLSILKIFKEQHQNSFLQIIPLHEKRLKMRGFNQVKPFESYLQKELNYKSVDILKRIKNTNPQALIKDREARVENIKNAFSVRENTKIVDSVILLDDVFTTGNTTSEAARLLKASGVKEVYVFTLAKD